MKLLYVNYVNSAKKSNYILFLSFGVRDGKLYGLDTSKVSNKARETILKDPNFKSLSIDGKYKWVKKYFPEVAKSAFRSLNQTNILSSKEYTVK